MEHETLYTSVQNSTIFTMKEEKKRKHYYLTSKLLLEHIQDICPPLHPSCAN